MVALLLLVGTAACDSSSSSTDPPLEPGRFRAAVEPGPTLSGEATYRLQADTTAGGQDTTFALRLQAGTITFPSWINDGVDSTVATGIFVQLPRSTPPVPDGYALEQEGPFFLGPNQVVLAAPESSLRFPILYNIESGTLTVTQVERERVYGEVDASARSLPTGFGPSTVEVTGRFVAVPKEEE